MSDSQYYVPESLNEPFKIFCLTIDELFMGMIVLIISLFFLWASLAIIAGIAGAVMVKMSKKGAGGGWLINLAYWYLPAGCVEWILITPPSFIRFYIA